MHIRSGGIHTGNMMVGGPYYEPTLLKRTPRESIVLTIDTSVIASGLLTTEGIHTSNMLVGGPYYEPTLFKRTPRENIVLTTDFSGIASGLEPPSLGGGDRTTSDMCVLSRIATA